MFKVVRKHFGKLYSATGNMLWTHALSYEPGKITVPEIPGSKLFVFKHLYDATKWAKSNSFYNYEIEFWEVECTGVRALTYMCDYLHPGFYAEWWQGNDSPQELDFPAPTGTYVADSVKLLERLNVQI